MQATHLAILYADRRDRRIKPAIHLPIADNLIAAINADTPGDSFFFFFSPILKADRGDRRLKSPSVSLA